MAWYPIAFLPPQYENPSGVPYSGAVLKAYAAGTNTNIPLAIGYTGVTTAASLALNAAGYPVYNGNVVIPHVQENYKLALYPNQSAADADSGALWTVDNIQIAGATNSAFVQYFSGDNSSTVFNLSQNFGTDENILMVFADRTTGSTKREIRRPNEYTVSGNQLTLNDVVPTGTNNIIVFAPSLLLGAANLAAAAAATSETNAATSATNAATSATNAATSATTAANLLDDFDDKYLGAKTNDPLLDNDGGALEDGALYWNTTNKQFRAYDLLTTTWYAPIVNPSGGPFVAKAGDTLTGGLYGVVGSPSNTSFGRAGAAGTGIYFPDATSLAVALDSLRAFLFTTQASAVNNIAIIATATGLGPLLSVEGSDTNIDLRLSGKGTGGVAPQGLLDISAATAGQLKFPLSQNASSDANTLDDYEEGTFTPTLTLSTPGDLAVVYGASGRVGHYTKIGQLVTVHITIVATSVTHTTGSGNIQVTGLPFTSKNTAGFASPGSCEFYFDFNDTTRPYIATVVAQNTSIMTLTSSAPAVSPRTMTISDFTSGAGIQFRTTISYIV